MTPVLCSERSPLVPVAGRHLVHPHKLHLHDAAPSSAFLRYWPCANSVTSLAAEEEQVILSSNGQIISASAAKLWGLRHLHHQLPWQRSRPHPYCGIFSR